MPDKGPATDTFMGNEVNREGFWPDLNVWCCHCPFDDRTHHFAASCITEGMHNSMMAVPALTAKVERTIPEIKLGSPAN